MRFISIPPCGSLLRSSAALVALAAVVVANGQTSWSSGSATVTGSWLAGPDVSITPVAGHLTWQDEHGSGSAVNLNGNPTDGTSFITSSNYSQITGSKYDYSGAEQIIYWYAYNAGSTTESVDWNFTFSASSQTNIAAGWGVQTSFGEIYEDFSNIQLLYDVVGAGYGTGSQSMTDSVGYVSDIAPNTYDLLVGITLSRSVLSDQTSTPSPAAAIPFAFGFLAHRRRRRAP